MKKSAIFLMLIILGYLASGQIVNTAFITNDAGVYIVCSSDFKNELGGNVQNNGTIKLAGNFTNNNNFNSGLLSYVIMNGAAQTIGGTNSTTFNNLTIEGSGDKTLLVNSSVANSLVMNANKILISNYNLSLSPSATIANSNNTRYVVTNGTGSLIKQSLPLGADFTFPVGNSITSYKPAIIKIAGTSDNFAVRVLAGLNPTTGIDPYCVQNTWIISEGTPGGTTAELNLGWNTPDQGGSFVGPAALIWQNISSTWAPLAGSPGATTNAPITDWYYKSLGVTDFSVANSHFTVISLTPPLIVNQPVSDTVCEGTNASFSITATGMGIITYQWQVYSGGSWADVSGAPYSGETTNTLSITNVPLSINGYQYRCIVRNNGGLSSISNPATLTVNQSFIADVSIQAFDNPACSHTLVNFTATPVNGGPAPAYQWYLNGNPVGTSSSTYSNISLNSGNTIYCQMTSNQNCVINSVVLSDTITMVVSPIPITEAGPTVTYSGTPVQIGDLNNGPGTITWSPAAGLSDPTIAQPLASPAATTTYTITVNNNGCVRTDTVTVVFGGLGHTIAGKTKYLKKATAGNPAPNMPSYNAVIYDIDHVEVILKTSGGTVMSTTMSDALGYFQFANIPDGNYILTYDHIPYDTMQYVNSVNAVDLALLKYLIGHDTLTDPSRSFTSKHKKAANVDNNATINTVDIARISAKIGLPYTPARNYPKGNWLALSTSATVAGADLNVILETVAYGDYDASSTRYKDSLTNWPTAKVLPVLQDENIITRSDETIIMTDPEYFEVPLSISTKMNELAAVGLELSYPSDKYKLVSASMSNTGKNGGAIKINPTLEEIIAANNDLLVTDDQGIIRVVYATTDFFDIAANDELVRLGFISLNDPDRGELDFNLNGTGLIANQYGQINEDAYLTMPKIFVQGNDMEAGFEFAGYPNPFSDDATLTYSIPENGTVKLKVYNAIGELVGLLVNESQISGKHSAVFSPYDLSAGMYTFKLEFTGLNKSKCMVLKLIH